MNNKLIEIQLPTDYTEGDLRNVIRGETGMTAFHFKIDLKSLDARKKDRIHWNLRVWVSDHVEGLDEIYHQEKLIIPRVAGKRAAIAGSGPAGFFAGYVLALAGFEVTIFEKGPETDQRYQDIRKLEETGIFTPYSNYAHGEGGAGTFSDGKLTSRTKNISKEKRFVLETYVNGGAPEEIQYLAKPHIGSDNLRKVIPSLRNKFLEIGGNICFNEPILDFKETGEGVTVVTSRQELKPDILIFAPGHSSFETYRMMMRRGIEFMSKPFAIGVRVEHPQNLINRSQWGTEYLKGVKAADYKLTCSTSTGTSVYSFCMCPGGQVVPAGPEANLSVVNGVSDYMRDSGFANSGIVAGISIPELTGRQLSAYQCLEYLENLEEKVFRHKNNFEIPGNTIRDFIYEKVSKKVPVGSYPFAVYPSDFRDYLPGHVITVLKEGMIDFSRKIKGFEKGIMMGLESKTSAPIRALRDEAGRCNGLKHVYIAGEGSGYSGGIVSSAVDGIRIAMKIINSQGG